ncbi:uncharacterized protein LOC119066045 [Bradysia coprophila]|uniref:uncharacterized protein LOC119066045 n=1 Tax=Bradysia coprophila TaxID=38358 RepID=UPI00187D744F|nr:uncharacterized protein LOC119066045 [Bradysia coprophila]
MAAKHWNAADISLGEKCKNLEKDCMNAPLHCLGVHDECSEYFCTKTTSPEARDNLTLLKSEGLLYEILGLCQHYFANKAKSLLAGYDTNVVEGFNSIIAKHLGGKRVNNVLAGSYKSRTAMASVHLNSGYHGISTFQKFKYGKALPETVKMENSRKRKVKMNTIHNEENNKRRRVEEPKSKTNKKRSYASGGIGHEDVDLTPEQFEIAKQRFLNRLNEDRHNRHNILIETQQQKYSVKYCQIKQDLLTSSYFSRILHSRSRKSYKKIVEDILYHNALYTNTADQNHQRLHQSEALKIFSDLYKNEPIELCGIFIDEKYSFLGASPYRLIGRHGILVIKCPRNAFKSTICEAINKKKIPFWSKSKASDTITVNVDSHWYMQIQGQLHVSGKQFAYLMVYLGPSEFKIEKIDRDDEYWKIKMEPELLYFFNEAMLKELVDPRSSRFMELRDYDEKNKIFERKITVRRNPIRATKRIRFLDTIPSSTQESDPSTVSTSNTVPTSVSASKCAHPHAAVSPKTPKSAQSDTSMKKSDPVFVSDTKSIPVSVSSNRFPPCATTLTTVQQSAGSPSTASIKSKSRKSKNFIRFRFQIDCTAAVDLSVDELVEFLKSNLKIEGQKKNLSDVAIEGRNANVNILAKVMVKKKYLKLLSKKFLYKKKMFNYRLATKNKRAYKIVQKAGPSTVPK